MAIETVIVAVKMCVVEAQNRLAALTVLLATESVI